MTQHDDLDRSIARWFDAEARPVTTADVLDRALRVTSRRRPRPRLFAALGSDWVGEGAGPTSGGVTLGRTRVRPSMALLLLLLGLGLVAGALLVGAGRLQPAPHLGHLGHLAYVLEDGLYVAGWDGQNPRRIVSPSQVPGNIPDGCRAFWGGPTWSPDGHHLAIRLNWDDPCEGLILITDAEGSSLTTIPASGWHISWSPDSSRIVTWVATWETIGVYGVDGVRQALLPAPRALISSGDHDPSWTPDGAAALVPDGVVVPLDGTAPHVDTSLSRFTSRSRVSPDGTMIADPVGAGIVVAATDGSSERVLRLDTPSAIGQVLWSPTGDRIAYQVGDIGAGIVDVATGATTSLGLPSGEGYVDVIRFSPEGDKVLLGSRATDGRSSLWTAQANGSGARELLSGSAAADWQWLPPRSESTTASPNVTPTLTPSDALSTVPLAADPPVIYLRSWREDFIHEVAIYADGRVIWLADEVGYIEQRLTPEGVEQLRSRATSTGLFKGDLALGIDDVGWGHIKVLSGDLPVIVAWGGTPADVSGLGFEDRFARASSAQAVEVTELESFLHDPTTWGFSDDLYVQPDIKPFVPTHLWVSFDRSVPNLSNLPSPAREVVAGIMGPDFRYGCDNISLDQAREIAQALAQAGIIAPDYDVRNGFAFSVPSRAGGGIEHGTPSFVHAHPALPDESSTVCGGGP